MAPQTIELALGWLKSALDCKEWVWDADQRQAAEEDLTAARAALAEVRGAAEDMLAILMRSGTASQSQINRFRDTLTTRNAGRPAKVNEPLECPDPSCNDPNCGLAGCLRLTPRSQLRNAGRPAEADPSYSDIGKPVSV